MTHFKKSPGGRSPSTSHMPRGSGKMSSKSMSKSTSSNNMTHNSSNAIGKNCRSFHNTLGKTPGKK